MDSRLASERRTARYWAEQDRLAALLDGWRGASVRLRCGRCRRRLGTAAPHVSNAFIYWEGQRHVTADGRTRSVAPLPGGSANPRPHITVADTTRWPPGGGPIPESKRQHTFTCKCGMRRTVVLARQVQAFVTAAQTGGEIRLGVDL